MLGYFGIIHLTNHHLWVSVVVRSLWFTQMNSKPQMIPGWEKKPGLRPGKLGIQTYEVSKSRYVTNSSRDMAKYCNHWVSSRESLRTHHGLYQQAYLCRNVKKTQKNTLQQSYQRTSTICSLNRWSVHRSGCWASFVPVSLDGHGSHTWNQMKLAVCVAKTSVMLVCM